MIIKTQCIIKTITVLSFFKMIFCSLNKDDIGILYLVVDKPTIFHSLQFVIRTNLKFQITFRGLNQAKWFYGLVKGFPNTE